MRRIGRYLAGVAGIAVIVVIGAWIARSPSAHREWIPEQAVTARAHFGGDTVRIDSIRNFEYHGKGAFRIGYVNRVYDLARLESVWYVLTPFSRQWRGPAHSFVSFGFSDSQFVAISVEARREPGETYGALTGLFRQFELMYVVGDERDLIGQRAAFSGDRVYLYPIRATPQRMREMFVSMLRRANTLAEHPEFYNTLTNNCTSNVVAHVNYIAPNTVPAGLKTMLPGYTDEVAHRLGLLGTDLDLDRARERFLINERARRFIADPAFSLRIRDSLPVRLSSAARPAPPAR